MARVLHLDINHLDILEFVFAERQEPHKLNDVLTLPQNSGVVPLLKQRKQYLEALQEETFGSTK